MLVAAIDANPGKATDLERVLAEWIESRPRVAVSRTVIGRLSNAPRRKPQNDWFTYLIPVIRREEEIQNARESEARANTNALSEHDAAEVLTALGMDRFQIGNGASSARERKDGT